MLYPIQPNRGPLKALFVLSLILMAIPTYSQQSELGVFDRALTIGAASEPGDASFEPETGVYTLSGPEDAGALHYLWTTVQGDFLLRAEVTVAEDADAGIMLRDYLGSDAIHAQLPVPTRTDSRVESDHYVLELRRSGDTLSLYAADFGQALSLVEEKTSELRNEIFAGLYAGGGAQVQFRNVRITKPAPESLVPYRDYLGSRLEILDVETGQRTVLLTSDHSLQAPNWTPDGKYLIYNSNGYLYRYRLADGHVEMLNTGFATRNNNDHVLTFDGQQLGISHHVAEEDGASTIFVLPVEGSDAPRRITLPNVGHSYLHGFSPDAKQVVFTGGRNDKYDIYLADVDTGEETAVTDTPGLDDGPEFSADGRYIYFNSNRSGMMQLWRVEPDGSNPTRMTEDHDYNDWFPHLSPGGDEIIFLSFGTDVESSQHPFYKHVTLRTMPVDGGEPRIVAYVYGGQGTINVPSWSPDGKKVAFISNTGF